MTLLIEKTLNVTDAVSLSCRRIAEMLPDIDTLSNGQLVIVLLAYRYAIEPNFFVWLSEASTKCRSKIALKACEDNVRCEIGEKNPTDPRKQNHRKMLRDFTESLLKRRELSSDEGVPCVIRAQADCAIRADLIGSAIRHKVINGLLVMALLENGSLSFIEWMRRAAQRLDLINLVYLDVHGEADIAHAQEFIEALHSEINYTGRMPDMALVCELIESFLSAIFHAHLG